MTTRCLHAPQPWSCCSLWLNPGVCSTRAVPIWQCWWYRGQGQGHHYSQPVSSPVQTQLELSQCFIECLPHHSVYVLKWGPWGHQTTDTMCYSGEGRDILILYCATNMWSLYNCTVMQLTSMIMQTFWWSCVVITCMDMWSKKWTLICYDISYYHVVCHL